MIIRTFLSIVGHKEKINDAKERIPRAVSHVTGGKGRY